MADDIQLSDEEVTQIAGNIEVKLYNVHNQEVNSKYRNKLRSLLFNLKDNKNRVSLSLSLYVSPFPSLACPLPTVEEVPVVISQ